MLGYSDRARALASRELRNVRRISLSVSSRSPRSFTVPHKSPAFQEAFFPCQFGETPRVVGIGSSLPRFLSPDGAVGHAEPLAEFGLGAVPTKHLDQCGCPHDPLPPPEGIESNSSHRGISLASSGIYEFNLHEPLARNKGSKF